MPQDTLSKILAICENTQSDVGDLKKIVCGDPADPSKGLIIRIDRIEQSAANLRKFVWVVVGAIVTPTSIGSIIWYLLSQSPVKP